MSKRITRYWALILYKPLNPVELKARIEAFDRGEPFTLPIAVGSDSRPQCCLVPHPSYLATFGPDQLINATTGTNGDAKAFPLTLADIESWFIRHGDCLEIEIDDEVKTSKILSVNTVREDQKRRLQYRPFTMTPYPLLNVGGGYGRDLLPFWRVPREVTMQAPLVAGHFFKDLPGDMSKLMYMSPMVTGLTYSWVGPSRTGKTITLAELIHQMALFTALEQRERRDEWHIIVCPFMERAKDSTSIYDEIKKRTPHRPGAFEIFAAPAGLVDANGMVYYLEYVFQYARRIAETPGKKVLLVLDSAAGAFQWHTFSNVPKTSTAAVKRGAQAGSISWLTSIAMGNVGVYSSDSHPNHRGGELTVINVMFSQGRENSDTLQLVAYEETHPVADHTVGFTQVAAQYPKFDTDRDVTRGLEWVWLEHPELGLMWQQANDFIRGPDDLTPRRSPAEKFLRLTALAQVAPFGEKIDWADPRLTAIAASGDSMPIDSAYKRDTSKRSQRRR